MEEANTTSPPVTTTNKTEKPSSPSTKKNKSKRLSPELDNNSSSSHIKKQKSPNPLKAPSSPPSLPAATPMESPKQVIAEEQEEKIIEEPRKPQPLFKYTTFPVKGYSILPTRNITSTFARNDVTYFPGNKAGAEEIAPNVS